MKINIISTDNYHSLSADCEVIAYCLRKFYKNKKLFFRFFSFQQTQGNVADINIFVGLVSNFFIKYAPTNILIIDAHKFDESWIPYLTKMDYILGKTDFALTLLREKIPRLQNIGWKTLDLYENLEKDYQSFLCVCGTSYYRQLSTILELWKPEYPKLHILCGKNYLSSQNIDKKEQDNITYQEEFLSPPEYNKLLNSYGIHICLSSASSFSNTLQNCISVKSIPLAMDNVLNRSFITHQKSGFLVKTRKKKKLKNNYGSEYLLDNKDFQDTIQHISQLDELTLEEIGEKAKKDFRTSDREFEKKFKDFFDQIWKKHLAQKPLKPLYEKFDEDFPTVSIITPTFQRNHFFKLAIRNFQKMDYPQDKVEWIIVEDGLEENSSSVPDLLPSQSNIRYFSLQGKNSIGYKRNYACQKAQNEIIVCMDDDDYYQPGSVKYRVACLEHLQKQVVASTSMCLFNINRIISTHSTSSFIQTYTDRFFESSMAFYRSHWEKHNFADTNVHEGKPLVENNLDQYEEIKISPIMVSLCHHSNTNKRVSCVGETNGSHYNFSDELFTLLTSLDEQDEDIKLEDLNKDITAKEES